MIRLVRTGLRRRNLILRVVSPEDEDEDEPPPSLPAAAPSVTMDGQLEPLELMKDEMSSGIRDAYDPNDNSGDQHTPLEVVNGSEKGCNLLLAQSSEASPPAGEPPADGKTAMYQQLSINDAHEHVSFDHGADLSHENLMGGHSALHLACSRDEPSQAVIADQLRLNVAWEDLGKHKAHVRSEYNKSSWARALLSAKPEISSFQCSSSNSEPPAALPSVEIESQLPSVGWGIDATQSRDALVTNLTVCCHCQLEFA